MFSRSTAYLVTVMLVLAHKALSSSMSNTYVSPII